MSQSKGTPRNPRINYQFKRPEFDFMFQWAAGSRINGGVEGGECFYIGGGDAFVEDLYAYIGPAGNKRGYHILLVDLPGQGLLPFEGMTWRNDSEAPMKAVVDFALGRPEVDGEKLAAYGISGGGYLVPRAVTCEKRIKACIGCSINLDLTQAWDWS